MEEIHKKLDKNTNAQMNSKSNAFGCKLSENYTHDLMQCVGKVKELVFGVSLRRCGTRYCD